MTASQPAGEPAAAAPAGSRLAVLAAGMFVIGTDSYVIAPLLSNIARDVGVGIAAAAQLITIYALAYAVCSPFVATVTAHWPRERALVAGLAIFVVANAAAAVSPGFAALLVARAFSGLGAAIFAPLAAASAAGLVAPNRRGRALSVLMIGLSSATAFGSPLGIVIGSVTGWRMVFVLVASLASAVAVAVALSIRIGAEGAAVPFAERLRPLRDGRVLTVLLTTFLVLTGLYLSYTYISAVFDRVTGNNGTHMALLQSVWGFAGIVGASMAGRMTDRFNSVAVIRVVLALLIIDFALMPWASARPNSAAVTMLVWGLCGWGFVVPQQYRLIGIAPQSGPILLALYTMAVYAGSSASGVVGALALQFIAPHLLPLIGAMLILSGLVVDEISRRRRKRVSPALPGF